MKVINSCSINDAVIKSIKLIDSEGIESNSKDNQGNISTNIQVYNTMIQISNPIDRYLNIKGRNNNIFAMMAETFWTLAGMDKINPYLSFYLPRAKDFSDDGETWRAAYGRRIYDNGQFQSMLDELSKNPLSRQGVISIYDPTLDSKVHLPNGTKDIPCNNLLYCYSKADSPNKINLHITQRSGDVIWGLGSINIFIWTILQEIVANILRKEVGYYSHYVNNLHVYKTYDVAYNQFKNVLDTSGLNCLVNDHLPSITGFEDWTANEVKTFFSCVVEELTLYIEDKITVESLDISLLNLSSVLTNRENNSICQMISAVKHYTVFKKTGVKPSYSILKELSHPISLSIANSKFISLDYQS